MRYYISGNRIYIILPFLFWSFTRPVSNSFPYQNSVCIPCFFFYTGYMSRPSQQNSIKRTVHITRNSVIIPHFIHRSFKIGDSFKMFVSGVMSKCSCSTICCANWLIYKVA